MNVHRPILLILLAIAGTAPAPGFFGNPPDWIQRAVQIATPDDVGEADAVVLLKEQTLAVELDGTATRRQRVAIRVLTAEGCRRAMAAISYVQGSSRVRDENAWLVREGRAVKTSHSSDWIDASNDTFGAMYSDSRERMASFARDAAVGDVFAAELSVAGPMLFAEDDFEWGKDGLPEVTDTYRIELPAGLAANEYLSGEPKPERHDSADHRTSVWTLHDLPFLPPEPAAPSALALRPRLYLKIQPQFAISRFKPAVIQGWSDLCRWIYDLSDSQCDRNPALEQLARRVAAGSPDNLERIHRLGAYVQGLHYAALMEGLGKGLGCQPHKATQILAQGYGDCKDKANLLRALLREVGIDSYITLARVANDTAVRPEFPSAAQFNHAIIAINVGADVTLGSAIETSMGRLLFFDPTSEHTVLGDLPLALQGSLVFVEKPGDDALVRLPRFTAAEGQVVVRRATLNLTADGACTGQVSATAGRQAGATLRHLLFAASTDDTIAKVARQLLGESTRAVHLSNIVKRDDDRGVCGLSFEIEKASYLQFLRDSLIILRTDVFGRGTLPVLTARERHLPVKLPPEAFDDQVDFVLPPGMRADELPDPVSLSTPYGTYKCKFAVEKNTIRIVRRLELKPQLVPPADYPALRSFFAELGKTDHASIVLKIAPQTAPGT